MMTNEQFYKRDRKLDLYKLDGAECWAAEEQHGSVHAWSQHAETYMNRNRNECIRGKQGNQS